MAVILAIAVSFALLLIGVSQGVYMAYPLLGALGAFALAARQRGVTWPRLLQLGLTGIRQSLSVVMILLLIGVLVALWMASGTVPALVYWGLDIIQPRTFLLWAFILPGVVSVLIGTSFGSASTIGLALMTMATGSAIDPHLVAGAIISGVYIGDRCSPVSSSANLVATITGTSLHHNLRAMARTALLPIALSALLYGLLSLVTPTLTIDRQMQAAIAQTFTLHWSVILPTVVVLGLSALRVPVLYTLALSIGMAGAIAMVVQGRPPLDLLEFALTGFRLSPGEPLAGVFGGGGLVAMARVCGVVLASTALAGIVAGTGLLGSLDKRLGHSEQGDRDASAAGHERRFVATGLVGIVTAMFGCTQTIAILLTQQLVQPQYHRHHGFQDGSEQGEDSGRKADKVPSSPALALDLENTVVVLSPLVPWNIAGLVPATVLMTDAGFIPFAVYLYLQPLVVLAQLRARRFSRAA
ncbi:MAG: Na+/H+ antiporter NhaC family protein [Elainellaceae cyanobacterium]